MYISFSIDNTLQHVGICDMPCNTLSLIHTNTTMSRVHNHKTKRTQASSNTYLLTYLCFYRSCVNVLYLYIANTVLKVV